MDAYFRVCTIFATRSRKLLISVQLNELHAFCVYGVDDIPVTKAFVAYYKSSSIFKISIVKSRKNTKYAIWCFSVSSSEIMTLSKILCKWNRIQ